MKPEDIEFIEPKEIGSEIGWSGYEFCYKGKRCESEILDNPIAKRRKALAMISHDLSSCCSYLVLLANDNNCVIDGALYKAFVITYAKCFVSGKDRGLSLKAVEVFSDFPKELKAIHESIMKARHKFVAHSDCLNSQKSEICIIYPPENTENLIPHIVSANLEFQKPVATTFNGLVILISELQEYVDNLIVNCDNNLIEKARDNRKA